LKEWKERIILLRISVKISFLPSRTLYKKFFFILVAIVIFSKFLIRTKGFEYETVDIPSSVSHIQKSENLNEALSNIKVENITSLQVKEKSNVLDAKMDIDDISSLDVRF
jgi:hypothetical protein